MSKLQSIGIKDIQLFFDDQIKMWAVVQVNYTTNNFILPKSYGETKQQPYLLWWCKNDQAKFREPNDQDLVDIITIVKRAPTIWEQGEKRADHFDELDAEKDHKHRTAFKEKIKDVAPAMKRAVRKELG